MNDSGNGLPEALHGDASVGTGEPIPMARPVAPGQIPFARPREHPILLTDMSRPEAWMDLVLAVLLLVAWDLVVGVVLRAWLYAIGEVPFDGEWTPQIQQRVLVPGLVLRAAGIVALIFLLFRRRGQSPASIGLTRRGWAADLLIGATTLFVLYTVMFLFMLVLFLLWPDLIEQMNENAERLLDIVPPLSALAFVPVALLIGVYEEILFRGFLMTRLRRGTGSWTVAVLISTAVFTVLHAMDQTPVALMLIVLLSLIFSVLTIWRRSILPAIVAHALFDYTQFLFLTSQVK